MIKRNINSATRKNVQYRVKTGRLTPKDIQRIWQLAALEQKTRGMM